MLATYLAVRTTQRRGVKTNVGRIVPNRYSFVTTRIPARTAKTEAKLPIPRKFRWSSGPLREPACDRKPVSSTNSSTSTTSPTTQPDRRPRRADLQELGAGLTDHRISRSAVSSRKTSSRDDPSFTSSCRTIAARGCDLPDALARRSAHEQDALPSRSPRSPRGRAPRAAACACGERTRTDSADARRELRQRRLDHEPAAVDDQHAVDRLRDLGEHVARDEDRAPARRERAQEVAQPAHPLGVEPVRRLVEHEQLGIAQQRRGQPEPLPHSERVALHAPVLRRVELDQPQHLVDPRVGNPGRAGERAQVVAAGTAGVEVGRLEHRADAQRRPLQPRVRLAEHERAPARRLREAEQHPQRRRLASAVRAEEAGHGAGVELEREPVNGGELAVALRQRVGGDDGGHRRDSSRRRQNLSQPSRHGRRTPLPEESREIETPKDPPE